MAKASKEELQMIKKIGDAITMMQSHTDRKFSIIHVSIAQWKTLQKMREKKNEDKDIIYPGVVFHEDEVTINGIQLVPIG